MDHSTPGFLSITNSRTLLKLMSIESVMPSNHLILYLSLLLLPSIFPSIRVFFSESVLRMRWPKYWSFSFSISPSNEYSGMISFRMDWFDLLAVQETLKSLLQHHSSKASTLWCSAFCIVQLSHPYMTTGKTIASPKQTFVSKVVSLFFNMLSRLVIAFLSRSKHLLISRLQSPSAVILKPKKTKCCLLPLQTASAFSLPHFVHSLSDGTSSALPWSKRITNNNSTLCNLFSLCTPRFQTEHLLPSKLDVADGCLQNYSLTL